MNNESRWVTLKDGRRIKINDYMNDKIRSKSKKAKTYELYHGANSDFEKFDDKYIGSKSMGGLSYGKGHYFMTDKDDKFGGTSIYGRNTYKVKVALKNPFVIQENEWGKKLDEMGYNWNLKTEYDPSDFLKDKGYDSTIIKNGNNISEIIVYTNNDGKIQIIDKTKNY